MKELGDLSATELRTHLHRVADWIADYRERLESLPINPEVQPGDVRACLPTELPAEGVSMEELLTQFERIIVPGVVHWGHPRFLAYFGSTTTAPGIVAEALTAALNVSAMMWSVSPAATELEQSVLDWLRRLIGLPASFVGMVHDSASVGTLHALAAARELAGSSVRRDGLAGQTRMTLYASDQAHSSIDKAVFTLTPSYLEGDAGRGPADAMDMSLQLGRRFRALKAWMVWRCFGAAGLAARIREHLRLARLFAEWIDSDADFELAAPVTMGVVCFRC